MRALFKRPSNGHKLKDFKLLFSNRQGTDFWKMSSADTGQDESKGDSIKVFVRIRPPETYDVNIGSSLIVDVHESGRAVILHSKPDPKVFTYDHVASSDTTQESIFDRIGKKIIENCIKGYNSTIFAYGQTGSGKTFTMLGPSDEMDNFQHELRGIIPRSFEHLFNMIHREQELHGNDKEFLCKCSFLEIYNEQVFDLLEPSAVGLHLRENMKKGIYVEGLSEQTVLTASEAYEVLSTGWINRRVASTSMNRESSRSHAVFTVVVESKEKKSGIQHVKTSLLNLVDLAGSERQKDTHTTGERLKEAGSINKSLSILGKVIMSLVDVAQGKKRHTPYRDSKLTFLLRDSLGGNAKTHIIACVHPGAKCFGETLSTLNFARQAKMIKNKAVVNQDTQGNVLELQAEIRRQKELIEQLQKSAVVRDTVVLANNENLDESEWKERFVQAMMFREKSENDKKKLMEKIKGLDDLCNKKEKFLQSSKMIIKFRENAISRLEKSVKQNINMEDTIQDQMMDLKSEIKALQEQLEHHPMVRRHLMVIDNLKVELNQCKMERNNLLNAAKYEELEKSFKELVSEMQKDPEQTVFSPSSTPQSGEHVATGTIEKYKSQIEVLQDEISTLKQSTLELKEAWQKKEMELNAELESEKKTVTELKTVLEAQQIRSKIEKDALNDKHLQTITSITTPVKKLKYELRNRAIVSNSASNTPSESAADADDSIVFEDGIEGISDEAEPHLMMEQAHQALTDEIKELQEEKNTLTQRLEEYETDTIQLNQKVTKLEHQKTQLEEILNVERSEWHPKQEKLQLENRNLQQQLEESKQMVLMYKEENSDLKIVLGSADKELKDAKSVLNSKEKELQLHINQLSTQILKFEAELGTITKGLDEATEERDSYREQLETAQSAATFYKIQYEELETLMEKEQQKYQQLEKEKEEITELLETEGERNKQLLQQLESQGEEKEKKIYEMIENKSRLEEAVQSEKASNEEKQQIINKLTAELQTLETAKLAQQKTITENMEALGNFMSKNQELKSNLMSKSYELDEVNQKCQDLQQEINDKLSVIEELNSQKELMQKNKDSLIMEMEKEKNSFEMAESVLKDELECMKEDLEASQKELASKEMENISLIQKLGDVEKMCNNLSSELKEKTQKIQDLEKSQQNEDLTLILEKKNTDIDELKMLNCRLTEINEEYESRRKEKDRQIEEYKSQLAEFQLSASIIEQLEITNKDLIYKSEIDKLQYEESKSEMKTKIDQYEQELQMVKTKLQNESCEILQLKTRNNQIEMDLAETQILKEKNEILENEIIRVREYASLGHKKIDDLTQEKTQILLEKEDVTKELEALKIQYKKIEEENTKLASHQNLKQKIHYHQTLKEENAFLRDELSRKKIEITKLRTLYGKSGTPGKSATPLKNAEILKAIENHQTPEKLSSVPKNQ